MITLHHLSNSHSHVVLWLMEELGMDYNLVKHQRNPKTRRSPDTLKAIHPLAKAPTIEDHGIAMVESTGIIMYILETYGNGQLRPTPNTADAMRFYQMLTYIEGSAKAGLITQFVTMGSGVKDERLDAAIADYIKKPLTFLNDSLDGQDYLVKSMFTAADIQLTFFEESIEVWGYTDQYPNLKAHLELMRQRDGYKRAEEKGGPVGLKDLLRPAS